MSLTRTETHAGIASAEIAMPKKKNSDERKLRLFAKSFQDDLHLLKEAISSFRDNLSGPWRMTVILNHGCQPPVEADFIKYKFVTPFPDGYCHAMSVKACADLYCPDADLIWLFDSDMTLRCPTSLAQVLTDGGKPIIYWDAWDSQIDPQTRLSAHQVWRPAVKRSTGLELDRDWMVAPSWLYWPSTFRGARRLVEAHCGVPFLQAVYSNLPYDWHRFLEHPHTFCDMETLGLFAFNLEAHKYTLRQLTPELAAQSRVVQKWSHAGKK